MFLIWDQLGIHLRSVKGDNHLGRRSACGGERCQKRVGIVFNPVFPVGHSCDYDDVELHLVGDTARSDVGIGGKGKIANFPVAARYSRAMFSPHRPMSLCSAIISVG